MIKFFLPLFILISFWTTAQNTAAVTRKLDSLFEKTFNPNDPGGAVLLVKDGKIIYEKGFGVEDLKDKKPITTKTLFNVGSFSKTFVASVIHLLAYVGNL